MSGLNELIRATNDDRVLWVAARLDIPLNNTGSIVHIQYVSDSTFSINLVGQDVSYFTSFKLLKAMNKNQERRRSTRTEELLDRVAAVLNPGKVEV